MEERLELLSESALGKEWLLPEEEEAWKHLQEPNCSEDETESKSKD